MPTPTRKSNHYRSQPGHGDADPSPLQRLLVRRGLTYEEAVLAIRKVLPPPSMQPKKNGHGWRKAPRTAGLSASYLSKVANGKPPSLKLGKAIVRWARSLREELTLADLGIEVA